MNSQPKPPGVERRALLRSSAFFVTGAMLARSDLASAEVALTRVDANPTTLTRTWLGPTYWGNRLQDWRLSHGRLECIAPSSQAGARTVAVLTRELVPADGTAALSVRTGTLSGGKGFSGFLIGAGAGRLDYRAAALVQNASGVGGGLLCTYESDGTVQFRDHEQEANQLAYPAFAAVARSGPQPSRRVDEDAELMLELTATASETYHLVLTARDAPTGTVLSRAELRDVPARLVVGGVALVSSTLGGSTGARHWLRDLRTGGPSIATRTGRALGPIMSTMYSVSGSTLKLTAQLMPIGSAEPQTVRLDYRPASGGTWRTAGTTTVGPGFSAVFRVTDWDASATWSYRVVYAPGTPQTSRYTGVVQPDPTSKQRIALGMLNCSIHSYRPLDRASRGTPRLPGESMLGLYTPASLYFPYPEISAHLLTHDPDVYVGFGDQFYEHRPTVEDLGASPTLDFLYKYYLWLWSFRDLTRTKPSIMLVDDHDVFQGNLWGHGGQAATGDDREGGYTRDPSWVSMVQRCQTAHNPDPYDPTPVAQGISVYYAAFAYGGVSFALLEDRKWKSGDADGLDATGQPYPSATAQLLGARQEQFLGAWAAMHPGLPKVVLTQTLFASLQTDVDGNGIIDYDANGYPRAKRDRALSLIKAARALVLSGDQHLASVVRHGIAAFDDGPVQFVAPALGTGWQRWFEPGSLPASRGTDHTGQWSDAFGNRVSVLAVANPKVSFAAYRAGYPGTGQGLGDRNLKREGYGVAVVDKATSTVELHSWPAEAEPTAGGTEHPGWPVVVPFADL